MTDTQISSLIQRRSELEVIQIAARERLDYVSDESLKNNLTCDHKHPDGRWAESENHAICAICGCGMGYQHYLETK